MVRLLSLQLKHSLESWPIKSCDFQFLDRLRPARDQDRRPGREARLNISDLLAVSGLPLSVRPTDSTSINWGRRRPPREGRGERVGYHVRHRVHAPLQPGLVDRHHAPGRAEPHAHPFRLANAVTIRLGVCRG